MVVVTLCEKMVFTCYIFIRTALLRMLITIAVELQWLEHLWNHENMLETGVVRANKY